MVKSTKRAFTAHDDLLKSVIFRQAGTREKAVLEGVMNSIDAGATKIEIVINDGGLTITDNGKGFATRAAIIANFESFGRPHEAGDAVFGRYRMGRGQLFAFGKNEWRTRKFAMRVDAKRALTYELDSGLKDFKGCRVHVEWYDRIYSSTLHAIERELESYFKYVEVPVYINGTQVNTPASKAKWDLVEPDYYVKFSNKGAVEVYNLGAFVRSYPARNYGTGGVVVSRKQLDVNFARNDVVSECQVWRAVQATLRAHSATEIQRERKKPLTDQEREFWLIQLRDDQVYDPETFAKLPLFTDVAGRNWSLREMRKYLGTHGSGITAAPLGDAHGDRIQQAKQAFVLSTGVLDLLGDVTPESFVKRLDDSGLGSMRAVDFKRVSKTVGHLLTIPKSEYTPVERVMLEVISNAFYGSHDLYKLNGRNIRLGVGQGYKAWTDGRSYITFDRNWLSSVGTDEAAWQKIAKVWLHEYLHSDSNENSHVHTPEFFEQFHELSEAAAEVGYGMALRWIRLARGLNRRLAKQAVNMTTRIERLERATDDSVRLTKVVEQAQRLAAEAKTLLRQNT